MTATLRRVMTVKLDMGEMMSKKPQSHRDLVVIAFLSILIFAVSATFDLFNKLITWVYRHDTWQLDELFTVFVFLMIAFAIYAWRRHKELLSQIERREKAEAERAELVPQLESARADISTLKKLLPLCASCKKVRDDTGYWSQVEVYIEAHFHTKFDEWICPECARKLYKIGRAHV
jgi:hypothetical protein